MPEQVEQPQSEDPARLKITEIFYSLQGEARNVGLPTVFVRLTGCPLRCAYCDTSYAFSGGEWMDVDAIIGEIKDGDSIVIRGNERLRPGQSVKGNDKQS